VTGTDENRGLIAGFWVDLYRQDFVAVGARFDDQGEYTDIVTPADDVARGPAEITARLRLAFDQLSKLFDEPRHLVAGEDVVMTEHVEHREWPTGETMALDVASVHEIRDGKIIRWCDYWDMNVLAAVAPQWWFEHVLQGWKWMRQVGQSQPTLRQRCCIAQRSKPTQRLSTFDAEEQINVREALGFRF
jgi:limonene-1,2-epoxide hydrolase